MSPFKHHNCLAQPAMLPLSLMLGLAIALMVLLVPISEVFALTASSDTAHACCDTDVSPAPCPHCEHATPSPGDCSHHGCSDACDCSIAPDSTPRPADALALMGSVFALNAAAPRSAIPRLFIPALGLSKAPATPSNLRFKPTSPGLYLLNAALLL